MVYAGDEACTARPALGQVFRAVGRGFRACIADFGECLQSCSSLASMEPFAGLIEVHRFGADSQSGDARSFLGEVIASETLRIVVLLGITVLMNRKIIEPEEFLRVLAMRPTGMHVIATGPNPPQPLVDAADLVTEVAELKRSEKIA